MQQDGRDETNATDNVEDTIMKFTSGDVTIELSGSEDFVERQIRYFRHYLDGGPDGARPARAGSAAPTGRSTVSTETGTGSGKGGAGAARPRPSLNEFFSARAVKHGRGAIQEALLLFGYFLQEVEGQFEFSIEQIGGCFGVVGRPPPKNLHHAVGTMKRKQAWFQEGSKRGYYRVSETGKRIVRPL